MALVITYPLSFFFFAIGCVFTTESFRPRHLPEVRGGRDDDIHFWKKRPVLLESKLPSPRLKRRVNEVRGLILPLCLATPGRGSI
jgi:hypothetical protein